MSTFHKVAELSDVGKYDIHPVEVGEAKIILYWSGEELRACQRYCVHQGADLSEGIVSRGFLVCAAHAWRFDADTGVHEVSPETCLAVYRVHVDGQDVLVDPTPIRNGAIPS